jgi:hypothetical protein
VKAIALTQGRSLLKEWTVFLSSCLDLQKGCRIRCNKYPIQVHHCNLLTAPCIRFPWLPIYREQIWRLACKPVQSLAC